MTFTVTYRGADGAVRTEEAFEALRAKGIKAIKVVAADGNKANGEVRGVRKRAVVALVILAAACAGVAAFISGERTGATNPQLSTLLDPPSGDRRRGRHRERHPHGLGGGV